MAVAVLTPDQYKMWRLKQNDPVSQNIVFASAVSPRKNHAVNQLASRFVQPSSQIPNKQSMLKLPRTLGKTFFQLVAYSRKITKQRVNSLFLVENKKQTAETLSAPPER